MVFSCFKNIPKVLTTVTAGFPQQGLLLGAFLWPKSNPLLYMCVYLHSKYIEKFGIKIEEMVISKET